MFLAIRNWYLANGEEDARHGGIGLCAMARVVRIVMGTPCCHEAAAESVL